jgi:hypothetical protein
MLWPSIPLNGGPGVRPIICPERSTSAVSKLPFNNRTKYRFYLRSESGELRFYAVWSLKSGPQISPQLHSQIEIFLAALLGMHR